MRGVPFIGTLAQAFDCVFVAGRPPAVPGQDGRVVPADARLGTAGALVDAQRARQAGQSGMHGHCVLEWLAHGHRDGAQGRTVFRSLCSRRARRPTACT